MRKAALFLDRDGVVNIDAGYTYRQDEFVFVDGIFDLVAQASKQGYLVFIVTNQAGIGRQYYSEADFWLLMDWVVAEFLVRDGKIDKVYFCPHHPQHGIGAYHCDCECRKPKPGMLLQAAKDFDIDLVRSIFIGDKKSDMDAGAAAGVGTLLHFEPGKGCELAMPLRCLLDAQAFFHADVNDRMDQIDDKTQIQSFDLDGA